MRDTMTRIGVSMLIASTLGGCFMAPAGIPDYEALRLEQVRDPLATEKAFTPWRPPRQMAAFVHPHEDVKQGIMIGGHWVMVLLGDGGWYFEEPVEREPLPDQEATPEQARRALGSLKVPSDAVIPYRRSAGVKP